MKKRLRIILTLLLSVILLPASARHITIVISLDGCRWDYPQWYHTPFFDRMAQEGVASGLIPSYPSKTFPNHYTLATGLYPDHHGIVANDFFDPTTGRRFSLGNPDTKMDPVFYGGEPIWVTAQKQGLRTAVFYWPGSDVAVCNTHPNTYYLYDAKPHLTYEQRTDLILAQLKQDERQRPDLIMAYMEQPDANGHRYGPQAPQTQQAVCQMDSLLGALYQKIQQLPIAKDVNLIVLSDHGMSWIPQTHKVDIIPYLKKGWIRDLEGNMPANLFVTPGCTDSVINNLRNVPHIRVWKREEVPAYLHYGTNDREGDVIVDPQLGWVVYHDSITAGGNHGFDPTYMDMHAIFRAVGPDFRHIALPHFKNVDVYPLLCRLLRIEPAKNDGNLEEIKSMLNDEDPSKE